MDGYFYNLLRKMLPFVFLLPSLLSANDLFIKENSDQYLCKDSHLRPARGKFIVFKKRPLRSTSDNHIRLYRHLYQSKAKNFNSLTLTRLVKKYQFSEKKLRESAFILDYTRNAFERYAYIRLLVRQKSEHLLMGINELLKYTHHNPLRHSDILKRKMGPFDQYFFTPQDADRGRPYEAFAALPKSCFANDPLLKRTLQIFSKNMQNSLSKLNIDSKTGQKIHPFLSRDSPIYATEKNIAVTSLQNKLRTTFAALKELKIFSKKLKGKYKNQLDLFIYYLTSKNRLKVLQNFHSNSLVIKHITKNREYSPWTIYLKILFSNKNERQKLLAAHSQNPLAHAIAELPMGFKLKQPSWRKAFLYLEHKAALVEAEMKSLVAQNPLLTLNYGQSFHKKTLFLWLKNNSAELKPTDHDQYSPRFDYEIQKALAYNFTYRQLPALKKICGLLELSPEKLICPENNTQIQNLIAHNEGLSMRKKLLKDERYLKNAALSMQLDLDISQTKETLNLGLEMGALSLVTLGIGPALSALAHGSKLASIMGASGLSFALASGHTSAQLLLEHKALLELKKMAKIGLNLYFLSQSIAHTKKSYHKALSAEENAHTTISSKAWGSQLSVDNAWSNFYLNSAVLLLNGVLSGVEFKSFLKESIAIKKGVAYTHAHTPKIILETLKKSGVKIKQLKSIKKLTELKNNIGLVSEAFNRAVSQKGPFIDAGAVRKTLYAEIESAKTSANFQALKSLRLQKTTNGIPAGTVIVNNGVVAESFEMVVSGGRIFFEHSASKEIFEISQKLFQIANKTGEYSIKIKNRPAWAGLYQGNHGIPIQTDSNSLGLLVKSMIVPKSALKNFGSILGGGIQLAVGGTIVAAAGVGLFLETSVVKLIVGAADQLKEVVPSHWEDTHESIDGLITRLIPKTINQVERQAKIREFTMRTHVRGVLDYFQELTNLLEDKLLTFVQAKWFIDGIFKKLQGPLSAEEKATLLAQLKGYIERVDYYSHRFKKWVATAQRNINYAAEWYTFYDENQQLFDKYWDYFYNDRIEKGFANEFHKECNNESCVLRYGIWVASFPRTGEESQELKSIFELFNEYKKEVEGYKKRATENYGLDFIPVPSDVAEAPKGLELKNGPREAQAQSFPDAKAWTLYLSSVSDDLEDRRKKLSEHTSDFDYFYHQLLSQQKSESTAGDTMAFALTEEEKNSHITKLLQVLSSLYTLTMRDFYQWKNHVKDVLESKLYQVMLMAPQKRHQLIAEIAQLSQNNITITEFLSDLHNTQDKKYILSYDLWHIATGKYEDSIALKTLEIHFFNELKKIEKKILHLKQMNLLPPMTKDELTAFY